MKLDLSVYTNEQKRQILADFKASLGGKLIPLHACHNELVLQIADELAWSPESFTDLTGIKMGNVNDL